MEQNHEQYCQSCGMPLRFDIKEYLGTNADSSRSEEYCYYCLKDGEYTVDIPMGQMVDIWVKYTDKYNEYSSTIYTPQELKTILNKRLPTLKRWKQKVVTENIHYEAVGKIITYIDQNLEKDINTEQLCEMVNLSFFHFRKVFKTITGENIGSYIQRLRLESVAHKLITTNLTAGEILKQTCYRTPFSLSKAFRKHFGMSMGMYKKHHKQETIENINGHLSPSIKKLNTQKAICYPVERTFLDKNRYNEIWSVLFNYRHKHLEESKAGHFISISLDNPLVTSWEQCRFYIGILTTTTIKPRGKFLLREISGGYFAIFRHQGNYSSLPELYRDIHERWLPQSGYFLRDTMSFEMYLNTPRNTEISQLLTDIYIPIEKRV